MIYLMKTCFFFKLIKHYSHQTKLLHNKHTVYTYKIIKQYYNAFFKRKNRHIRLLEPSELIELYLSISKPQAGLSNLFLKKWFFLKLLMPISNILINFARKVRIFNKSRYSRNRQNVRATFYFSIYFNILIIFTVFSVFYNLTFFMTYLWWAYAIFCLSMASPHSLKVANK